MNRGFWDDLPRPFFVLAPMSNLTNAAHRRIITACGKPDVIFTEFVSVEGLCSRGREKLLPDLWYSPAERPVVAQFFGRKPEQFHECAALAADLGFDGIDINMGCPDKAVLKQGAGSGLIQEPELASEIVQAAREGGKGLPISIKTRIGYQENEVETWIPKVLAMRPATLSLHGRTRRQKYQGEADWKTIARAADMAKEAGVIFVGNGDVGSREEGINRHRESGADGIMIGRAVIGNPWIFHPALRKADLEPEAILKVMCEHALFHERIYEGIHGFHEMRKFLTRYVSDFPGARQLRGKLTHTDSAAEVIVIAEEYLGKKPELDPPAVDQQQTAEGFTLSG